MSEAATKDEREGESMITPFEMEYMKVHLEKLMNHPLSVAFAKPVDPERDNLPKYSRVVRTPMDLFTVKKKLESNEYKSIDDFVDDINLIWENAIKFNGKKALISQCAQELAKKCDAWFEIIPSNELEQWEIDVSRQRKAFERILNEGTTSMNEVPVIDSVRLHFHASDS